LYNMQRMRANELQPEQRMILAVIFEAIRDVNLGDDAARQWLLVDRSKSVGSLHWYLGLLGLRVEQARPRLIKAIADKVMGKNQSASRLLRGVS